MAKSDHLIANVDTMRALANQDDPRKIAEAWKADLAAFRQRRAALSALPIAFLLRQVTSLTLFVQENSSSLRLPYVTIEGLVFFRGTPHAPHQFSAAACCAQRQTSRHGGAVAAGTLVVAWRRISRET